jgi:hypothetical protein
MIRSYPSVAPPPGKPAGAPSWPRSARAHQRARLGVAVDAKTVGNAYNLLHASPRGGKLDAVMRRKIDRLSRDARFLLGLTRQSVVSSYM